MQCSLCEDNIEEGIMGKIKGTIVKVNKEGKKHSFYICSSCQKKHGDKLEEEVSKKV